jgi:hypothetical protein
VNDHIALESVLHFGVRGAQTGCDLYCR